MTENDAIKALKLEGGLEISGKATRTIEFFNGLVEAEKALEEIQEYRAIGTIDEFKALKEKNEPKKAVGKRKYDEAYCPACNEVISDGEFWALDEYVHHCNYCGQAVKGVDWSE